MASEEVNEYETTLNVDRYDYRVVVDANGAYSVRRIYYDDDGKMVGRRWLDRLEQPSHKKLLRDVDAINAALRMPVVKLTKSGDLVEVKTKPTA